MERRQGKGLGLLAGIWIGAAGLGGVGVAGAGMIVAGPLQAQQAAGAASAEGAAEMSDEAAKFQAWLEGFRSRAVLAGISEATLDRALAGVALNPDIIRRDRNQNEHTRQLWDYLDTAVSADRVAGGARALAAHGPLLAQIEAKYGVEAEVVAAVWGLESAYGGYRGTLPVIGSLATLAFDPRRGGYFERELIEALKIVQAGHVEPGAFVGSWAGASGHTQFMPSSFWRFAVDWNGDGRRDLWGEDPGDALASAAAYLAGNGWQKGLPWGVEVRLPAGFAWDQAGERIKKPLAEWWALGVEAFAGGAAAPGVDPGTPASVLAPAGHEGTAFLIFRNFQVIETYNTADAYVIAVGTLSDRLAGRPAILGPWPRGDRALSFDEKKELQQMLLDLGHDPKGVDGIMGPNTIQAVRLWQASKGLVADGYASLRLVEALRAETRATEAPAALAPAAAEPAADPVPAAPRGMAPGQRGG